MIKKSTLLLIIKILFAIFCVVLAIELYKLSHELYNKYFKDK